MDFIYNEQNNNYCLNDKKTMRTRFPGVYIEEIPQYITLLEIKQSINKYKYIIDNVLLPLSDSIFDDYKLLCDDIYNEVRNQTLNFKSLTRIEFDDQIYVSRLMVKTSFLFKKAYISEIFPYDAIEQFNIMKYALDRVYEY